MNGCIRLSICATGINISGSNNDRNKHLKTDMFRMEYTVGTKTLISMIR